jgi:hypothetical protein
LLRQPELHDINTSQRLKTIKKVSAKRTHKMKRLSTLSALLLSSLPLRAQTPRYALAVSTQANRSAATFLASTSVLTGNAYVFTSLASAINANPAGIAHVCYWLDRAPTGTADHCEFATPYDLKGTFACVNAAGNCGAAWNTAALPDGWHTITQVVTLSTGATEVDATPFRTYNGSLLSLSATYDDGSAVTGSVVLQSQALSGASSAPATVATLPLATGAASHYLVLQTHTIYIVAVLRTDGTTLAAFPFALPSVLKVDPASLRSAAISVVFRLADQSLKQATPQVTFAF